MNEVSLLKSRVHVKDGVGKDLVFYKTTKARDKETKRNNRQLKIRVKITILC